MKLYTVVFTEHIRGRAPHGARGLKHECFGTCEVVAESRPAWGAWIETSVRLCRIWSIVRRAPHGARGLKLDGEITSGGSRKVAPHTGRVD